MNIIEKLNIMLPELTKSERRIAENLINNPIDFIRYGSADLLARNNNCSRASLIRLAQKLGYSGFLEFKNEFSKEMAENISPSTQTVLDYYVNAITLLNNVYSTDGFNQSVDVIKNAKNIYSCGFGHSFYSAQQFAFRLNRNKHSAHVIDQASNLEDIQGLLDLDNVLVIFSISGGIYSNTFLKPLMNLKEQGCCKIVLITMSENTPYSEYADATMVLPCVSRMCNTSIIDDAAVFFMAIEMINEKLSS